MRNLNVKLHNIWIDIRSIFTLNTEEDRKADLAERVKSSRLSIFRDNTTSESIEVFDRLKSEFVDELLSRLKESKTTTRLIEGYLNQVNTVECSNLHQFEDFEKPIINKEYDNRCP
jgi:Mg/Co/Ni transporter MgtE